MQQQYFTGAAVTTRAQRASRLASIRKKTGISKDGMDFVLEALDPYRDRKAEIAGYPDADNLDTVVLSKNFELAVSKPAGAAGNWDAWIFVLPFLGNNVYDAGNRANDGAKFIQTAENYTLDLVNIAKGDAGQDLYPDSPLTRTNYTLSAALGTGTYVNEANRIVGLGIEVIDTSPVVNQAGSITCYTCNSVPHTNNLAWENTGGTVVGTVNTIELNGQPSTTGAAIAFPSTVQWQAKDGCYMAVGLRGIENPFTTVTRASPVLYSSYFQSGDCLFASPVQTQTQASPATSLLMGPRILPVNVCSQGIHLSGLNNSGSFLLRVRLIIEEAPGSVSGLTPLATPSPPYDYKALALYSLVRTEMPVAVPVGFNAHGDWWDMILSSLEKHAPRVGSILGNFLPPARPIGSVVGQLAGVANQSLNDIQAARRRRKKANKNKNGSAQ